MNQERYDKSIGLTPEKEAIIRQLWAEGKIRDLGGAFAVPSSTFVMGITPRMVTEVAAKIQSEQMNAL